MKREFLVNIILLLLINILVKPLYLFGIEARMQNLVGTEEYGIYFGLFNFVFLFQVFNDPGIQNYNSRLIAQSPDQISFHFPRILGSKIMLALAFLMLTLGIAWLFDFTDNYVLLSLVVVNFFLSTLFVFIRSNLAAIGQYKLDSLLSSLDKILMILLLGYLVWFSPWIDQFSISWMIYSQMLCYGIACIVALGLLWQHLGRDKILFSFDYLKKLIKLCIPFAAIILLTALFLRMDGVMLNSMLDDNGLQAGKYAAGFRFFEAANMMALLFGSLLLPMFSNMISKGENVSDLINLSLRVMLTMGIAFVTAFISYRAEVMSWLYVSADSQYSEVMLYLLLAYLGTSLSYIYGAFLLSKDKLRAIKYIYIVGVICNCLSNFIFIPIIGATGAAVATLITQWLITLAMLSYTYMQPNIQLDKNIVIRAIFFGLLCALLYQTLAYLTMPWLISLTVGISFSLILALLSGVIDRTMLSQLIKKY